MGLEALYPRIPPQASLATRRSNRIGRSAVPRAIKRAVFMLVSPRTVIVRLAATCTTAQGSIVSVAGARTVMYSFTRCVVPPTQVSFATMSVACSTTPVGAAQPASVPASTASIPASAAIIPASTAIIPASTDGIPVSVDDIPASATVTAASDAAPSVVVTVGSPQARTVVRRTKCNRIARECQVERRTQAGVAALSERNLMR